MAEITITAPNPSFNGISAGVRFTDGVAKVSESQIAALEYFGRHRFGISRDVSTGDEPENKVAKTKIEPKGKSKTVKPGDQVDLKTATEKQAGIESDTSVASAGEGPTGPLHNEGHDAANPDGVEPPVTPPADAGI